VALGTAALLLARLALAQLRHGPILVADEVNYLVNARALAGGTPGELRLAGFSHGGYSLLVTPLVGLGAGPRTAYALVLALNAALAASLAPLLYLLLTRVLRAGRGAAAWAALAAAAYPSVTIFSQVALAENLLLPLTVAWLLLFAAVLRRPAGRGGAAAAALFGGCGAALYAAHGRMVVALALGPAALAVLALRRRLAAAAALAGIVAAAAGYAGALALDRFLVDASYGGRSPSEVGARLSSLDHAGGVLAVARNLAGESWYLAVASLGLLVLGASRAGALRARLRAGADGPAAVVALLLALAAGLLAVSALSFPEVERPDVLVYGRYVEVAVPPLLALALARGEWLERPGRVAAAAGALVAATAGVVALRLGVDPSEPPNRWNVASLPFLTLRLGVPSLAGAGAVAAGALAVLGLLARRRPRLVAPAVLCAFAATTAVVERNPVLSGDAAVYPAGWTSPARAVTGGPVAYDRRGYDVIGLYVYQWFLPRSRFELYGGAGVPRAPFVVSDRSWARRHPDARARIAWRDPGRDQAIFALPHDRA